MPVLIPVSPGPFSERTEFLADEAFAPVLATVLWHAPSQPSGPPRAYVRTPDGKQRQVYANRLVWWLGLQPVLPAAMTKSELLRHLAEVSALPKITAADSDLFNLQLGNLRLAGLGFGTWTCVAQKPTPPKSVPEPTQNPDDLPPGPPVVPTVGQQEIEDIFKL